MHLNQMGINGILQIALIDESVAKMCHSTRFEPKLLQKKAKMGQNTTKVQLRGKEFKFFSGKFGQDSRQFPSNVIR